MAADFQRQAFGHIMLGLPGAAATETPVRHQWVEMKSANPRFRCP